MYRLINIYIYIYIYRYKVEFSFIQAKVKEGEVRQRRGELKGRWARGNRGGGGLKGEKENWGEQGLHLEIKHLFQNSCLKSTPPFNLVKH